MLKKYPPVGTIMKIPRTGEIYVILSYSKDKSLIRIYDFEEGKTMRWGAGNVLYDIIYEKKEINETKTC